MLWKLKFAKDAATNCPSHNSGLHDGVQKPTHVPDVSQPPAIRYGHHPIPGGDKTPPFSDPDFDGKSLREVMDIMSRAKRWLESRGCVINLSGEYHETKIRKLKFE